MQIEFRPIEEDDQEFLYEVYASTREEELAPIPWDDAAKEEFLRMQHHAQHTYYQQEFSSAEYQIILRDGVPVGRLYLDRREDEFRVIDIALLTSERGKGTGGKIMRDILDEARAAGKPVRIHVLKDNRAMHLYERLDFRPIGDTGVYYLMEWVPTGADAPSDSRADA
jgi:GNAT superfamily N-acetyltransferase